MPNEMIDNDPSDFDTALQDLEYVSLKAKLMHQIEVVSRTLPLSTSLQKIRIQQEIMILQDKIRQLEKDRVDSRAQAHL